MQNEDLLKEIHRATEMGLKATQLIAPKIKDCGLKKEIHRQESCYQKLIQKSEDMLSAYGENIAEPKDTVKKAMLWGSVQLNTLIDSSPEHIAEMMINGTTMGIVDMIRKLNELGDVDYEPRKLAQEFIQGEQRHIEELKKHL